MNTKKMNPAQNIHYELKKLFPHVRTALRYRTRFQLQVAVMLSAQTTDKKVNEITRRLFARYTTVNDFATQNPARLARDIYGVNYHHTKARHIVRSARIIRDKHGGRVPRTMEELTALPGVARKTANIILSSGFGINEGIAVDTHVARLSRKFGLTTHTDPVKIENDLMKLLPREEWSEFSLRLIEYGRTYCSARRHECAHCPLNTLVP